MQQAGKNVQSLKATVQRLRSVSASKMAQRGSRRNAARGKFVLSHRRETLVAAEKCTKNSGASATMGGSHTLEVGFPPKEPGLAAGAGWLRRGRTSSPLWNCTGRHRNKAHEELQARTQPSLFLLLEFT